MKLFAAIPRVKRGYIDAINEVAPLGLRAHVGTSQHFALEHETLAKLLTLLFQGSPTTTTTRRWLAGFAAAGGDLHVEASLPPTHPPPLPVRHPNHMHKGKTVMH